MIAPLRNLILVELTDVAPREGAIHVVRTARPPSTHATVIAIGPKVRDVRLAARVVISRLQGIEIGDGKLLLPESAVLAQEPDAESGTP